MSTLNTEQINQFDAQIKGCINQFERASQLPSHYPPYLAFAEKGEMVRKCRTIGELPTPEMRHFALEVAAQELSLDVIRFGVPIYKILLMTKSDVYQDSRDWLLLTGADLPLSLFWEE